MNQPSFSFLSRLAQLHLYGFLGTKEQCPASVDCVRRTRILLPQRPGVCWGRQCRAAKTHLQRRQRWKVQAPCISAPHSLSGQRDSVSRARAPALPTPTPTHAPPRLPSPPSVSAPLHAPPRASFAPALFTPRSPPPRPPRRPLSGPAPLCTVKPSFSPRRLSCPRPTRSPLLHAPTCASGHARSSGR